MRLSREREPKGSRHQLRLAGAHQGAAALGPERRARAFGREGAEARAAEIAILARWLGSFAHPSPR